MIGGFIMREDVVEHGRRSIERGVAALGGAVAEAKALLRKLGGGVTPSQVDLAIDALAERWQSPEAEEGIAAFFDKRKPDWSR